VRGYVAVEGCRVLAEDLVISSDSLSPFSYGEAPLGNNQLETTSLRAKLEQLESTAPTTGPMVGASRVA
jgi:hypothetical protein